MLVDRLYSEDSELRTNVKRLYKLRRFGRDVPVTTSFTIGIKLLIELYNVIGQTNIARMLTGIMMIIVESAIAHEIAEDKTDDFVRKKLKLVSEWAFPKVFNDGKEYMLLMHLHQLGGKSPFTKDQIIDDINTWVSEFTDGDITQGVKNIDKETYDSEVDRIFQHWKTEDAEDHLSFSEFCNDPLRWGTSGGAPRTEWIGGKYRTKWAWALSKLCVGRSDEYRNDVDLYKESLKASQICNVALKEEAAKTREVITTPMSSYLRQSYLLYRWGKPDLSSPISNNRWLIDYQNRVFNWYGSIDGSRFDQSVPSWVIKDIINRLGDKDDDCRRVADEELKSLSNLKIRFGNKFWTWKGGLLSGWRITSLVGTIVSRCAAVFIIKNCNGFGAIHDGQLGDDLTLYSNTHEITKETMVDLYNKFGLHSNLDKTMSGTTGEFLRKTISSEGVLGYPVLAVKAITYANPWVTKYTLDNELEVTNSWLTLYSRLLPHTINTGALTTCIQQIMVRELNKLYESSDWINWLKTPISAGGGGPNEWSDISCWTTVTHIRESTNPDKECLIDKLGVLKPKFIFTKQPKLSVVNIAKTEKMVEDMKTVLGVAYVTGFKKGTNITKTLLDFNSRKINIDQINLRLKVNIPTKMRNAPTYVIVAYLLGLLKEESGITTVQHTKEQVIASQGIQRYISRAAAIAKTMTSKEIKPAMTLYANTLLRDVTKLYGTW